MKEIIILKDVKIEDYFTKLGYSTKDRLCRYRQVDKPYIDEYSRYHPAKQEDKRDGKVINNRAYKNLDMGTWELFATKLPNGDIITTNKKYAKAIGKKKGLQIGTGDGWEDEKELERIEKLCREGEVGSILDYCILMKL